MTLFGERRFVDCCNAVIYVIPDEILCQLHQWQLWLGEHGEAWPHLPPLYAELCLAAFCRAQVSTPSHLQQQVIDVLKSLGLQPREEVLTPQGYSLDAVVCVEAQ